MISIGSFTTDSECTELYLALAGNSALRPTPNAGAENL
jgi:hypothetical protein